MMEELAPDAVIVDYWIEGENGLALLKKVRELGGVPGPALLVITGDESRETLLGAFDAGADDYMKKPVNPVELFARVQAIVRRRPRPKAGKLDGVVSWKSISMEHATHRVTVAGKPVSLTPREYFLLRVFVEHPGEVFSKERLLKHLFGDQAGSSGGSIEVHLSNLRRKLGSVGKDISTVRSAGYRLASS